jgi:hypothetical protein
MLGGVLLFAADRWWHGASGAGGETRESISLTAADVARLRRQWTAEHGAAPDAAEERSMIERAVDERLLEREALRLGIDRGDRLVRDRLVKLANFLSPGAHASEDVAEREARSLGLEREDPVIRRYLVHLMEIALAGPPLPPSDAEVRARYERMAPDLAVPDRLRLTHIYLGRDRHGGSPAADAEQLLAELRQRGAGPEVAAGLGDPFAVGPQIGPASAAELSRLFGPAFAAAVAELPGGRWCGPVPSAYGLHLVWIDERLAARKPDFEGVRNRLVWQLVRERQALRLHAGLRRLSGT